MLKFPYAISDFYLLRTADYLYLDRTHAIPALEEAGRQLLFLRPRRFGKSLLLSMLANYYDFNQTEFFPQLFGDLAIGQQPTTEHNRYLILQWDFSKVAAHGDIPSITQGLFRYLNECANDFAQRYQTQLTHSISIYPEDALATVESLVNAVKNSGQQLYLLIDEYDNFANEVLMQAHSNEMRYKALLHSEGILKTLFKSIKGSAAQGKIGRVFITGVSPVVMSDMTSGYNVATSIYLDKEFNTLCGITTAELQVLVQQLTINIPAITTHDILETLRVFYNGYRFCADLHQERVYNPTLCFYLLRHLQKNNEIPANILDNNLAMDAGKIRYISQLNGGEAIIRRILDNQTLQLEALEDRFGVEALQTTRHGEKFMLSLLYYFGVLTITGRSGLGELEFGVPNLVIRRLYVEELQHHLLPDEQSTDTVRHLARQFYQNADLQPIAEFLENHYFAVFNNRDYRWSNELTIKTAFLTLLFNDTFYIMDSETALKRRYSDLTLIVRPNMRQYPALLDIVLEFKYLTLNELGLNAATVRQISREALQANPLIQTALQDALQQLSDYRQVLQQKYQEPQRLRCLAVVALGFERLIWAILT